MDENWLNKEHLEALFKNTTQAITRNIFGPIPALADVKLNEKNQNIIIGKERRQYIGGNQLVYTLVDNL